MGSYRFARFAVATAAVLALVAGGGAVTAPERAAADEPPECTVDALLVNSCRAWFGVSANGYPQVSGRKLDQMLYFEERVGRQMEIAHTFHGPGDNALTDHDRFFADRAGTFLLTNWALTRDWASADGSNDAVNAQIDAMAASVKSLGDTRIFLTLFHEPENDVTTAPECPGFVPKGTSGTTADYRAMWANVRARFDALGVTNALWVMNYMNHPPNNCLVDHLYPGDDLVDWVLFTGYQHGDRGVSFVDRVSNMYDLLTRQSRPGHDYLSKPWGIAEWGINNSTQENAYLYYAQAKAAVEADAFPRLRMYVSFDAGDAASNDASHRVAYGIDPDVFDQAEQDAYNLFAHSPALSGPWTYAETAPPPDTTAPTAPRNVRARLHNGLPRITWAHASDDVAVAAYDVLRAGVVVGSTSGRRFDDRSARQGRTYTYRVRARDDAGNVGPRSAAVRRAVPDTVAPTAPKRVRVHRTDRRRKATLRWQRASDNVRVARYEVYRKSARVGRVNAGTTRFVVKGLRAGKRYPFRVFAFDAAGNRGKVARVVG
jgi:hypothetical protein